VSFARPRAWFVRVLAAVLVLCAQCTLGQVTEPGLFLVAKPSILDPNFSGTVILVTGAPDGASIGVILNRPTKESLASILPGNDLVAKFTDPLYFGGPVERVGLFAVFRSKDTPGQTLPVVEDVQLALNPETVEKLLRNPPVQVRFFVGYSGWAPGQLSAELERGDWWTVNAEPDTVFRKNTDTLWDELSLRARAVTASAPPRAIRVMRSCVDC
jgi:putative transcriptional regulator